VRDYASELKKERGVARMSGKAPGDGREVYVEKVAEGGLDGNAQRISDAQEVIRCRLRSHTGERVVSS
jgi:hypothetical protein